MWRRVRIFFHKWFIFFWYRRGKVHALLHRPMCLFVHARGTTGAHARERATHVYAERCAQCGTALTEEHVKLLKRFSADRLVLSFDADAAGLAAAERVYAWEKEYELDIRVAALPPGVDPDDLARQDPAGLQRAVDEAVPFLKFRLDRVLDAGDMSTPEGKARAAEHALDVVREHPDPLGEQLVRLARLDRGTVWPRTLDLSRRAASPAMRPRRPRSHAPMAALSP